MTYCTLFVCWVLTKESFLSKYIASSYHVTNFLKIIVCQSDHKASIEHKVDVVNIIALFEQDLVLVHNPYLGALNDEFVRIVADLGQYFMM